jgi:hypothetical protein
MDWWSMLIGAAAFYVVVNLDMKVSRLKRRVEALEDELLEYQTPSTPYRKDAVGVSCRYDR